MICAFSSFKSHNTFECNINLRKYEKMYQNQELASFSLDRLLGHNQDAWRSLGYYLVGRRYPYDVPHPMRMPRSHF